ncbi:adenosylcobinamide-phosphate synthase CbiB [Algiphilus aromaticivorans]|uniref:adenosylcobinamide-phosphate synthase CbiB n=1 Tax=Algiphilus aromaticivorans TaxID=382454 RepID=UPI0012EC20B3
MLPFIVVLAALLLDRVFGEPRHAHPLVAFGRLATAVEARLHADSVMVGGLAMLLVVLPFVGLAWAAAIWLPWPAVIALEVLGLYAAIGLRSLSEHARAVAAPLAVGDLPAARAAVGRMVSRDTRALDGEGVATAATESVLENGADAVTASIFWYLLAGLPGVVGHRLVNTLDAMWGYRSPRYARFGCAAARLDDVLNWVPARLTALGYALAGRTAVALRCWCTQARTWESPNAGPVMAAGAGALGLHLGGPAPYAEGLRQRPLLGEGMPPTADSITAALGLLHRSILVWLVGIAIAGGGLWAWRTAVA